MKGSNKLNTKLSVGETFYIWFSDELGMPCSGYYKALKELDLSSLHGEFTSLPQEPMPNRVSFEEWLTTNGYIEYVDARHFDFKTFQVNSIEEFTFNN